MRHGLFVLLLSTAVPGIGIAAQAPVGPSAPPASTTLRMRGTIDKYDTATRVLTLSTPGGPVQFPLGPSVRIRQGRATIDAKALATMNGSRTTIRYSESGGNKLVESLTMFGRNERITR